MSRVTDNLKSLWNRVREAISPYRKAWASGISTILVGFLVDMGFQLSDVYVVAISAAVGSFMTWLIPNEEVPEFERIER